MAETLTSKAVAAHLNTDARTLRRFLRDDPTYRNAGSGGRYTFTGRDLPTITKRFTTWQAGVDDRRAKRNTTGLIKKSKTVEHEPEVIEIPKCTDAMRRLEAEQVARLDNRLRECGLHLSQLRRAEWARIDTSADVAS